MQGRGPWKGRVRGRGQFEVEAVFLRGRAKGRSQRESVAEGQGQCEEVRTEGPGQCEEDHLRRGHYELRG